MLSSKVEHGQGRPLNARSPTQFPCLVWLSTVDVAIAVAVAGVAAVCVALSVVVVGVAGPPADMLHNICVLNC